MAGRVPRQTLLLIFCFLLYFALLDTFHTYVGYWGEGRLVSLQRTLYAGLVFWAPYFLILPGVLPLVDRYRLGSRPALSFLIHAVAALVFTYAHISLDALVFEHVDPGVGFLPRAFRLLRLDSAVDYLTYWGMALTGYILQYYSELQRRQVEASQMEAKVTLAQLRTLQAQLHPHFFFNTLQVISVLALAGEKEAVVETLGQLGSLIRLSFDDKRPQQVPLAHELEFLDIYLAIQQLSFGERLLVRRQIESQTLRALVPSMVLQPLVENAIVHGIAKRPGDGTIEIEAALLEEHLLLRVEDSGPGFTSAAEPTGRIGLNTTEARLKLLYGKDYRIEFGRSHKGGASVTLLLPLILSPVEPVRSPDSRKAIDQENTRFR